MGAYCYCICHVYQLTKGVLKGVLVLSSKAVATLCLLLLLGSIRFENLILFVGTRGVAQNSWRENYLID